MMDMGRIFEGVRQFSLAIILVVLIPYFSFYMATLIIRYTTGVKFQQTTSDVSELEGQLREADAQRDTAKALLKRGDLSLEERTLLEQQKKEIEEALSPKKLGGEERKKLEQKSESLDQKYDLLKKDYDAREMHNKEVREKQELIIFLICIVFGILFLVLGYLTELGHLGAGFILGAAFTILTGLTYYWSHLDELIRVASLALALAAAIAFSFGLAKRNK